MKLDNKGLSLIQSLLGFFIYINVIVVFISLLNKGFQSEIRLNEYINRINNKEVILLEIESFDQIIRMVLH